MSSFVISIVSTFNNEQGKLAGVVGMDVGLNGMTDMIKNIKLGKSGYIILADSMGTIIAHPQKSELNLKNIADLNIKSMKDVSKLTGNSIETDVDGKESVVARYTSDTTGWRFIAVMDKKDILAEAAQLEKVIIVIAFIFLLIAIFVSMLFGNKLSKPIEELEGIMKSVQLGDFSKQVSQKLIRRKDVLMELQKQQIL